MAGYTVENDGTDMQAIWYKRWEQMVGITSYGDGNWSQAIRFLELGMMERDTI